jgi:hypothetical protein
VSVFFVYGPLQVGVQLGKRAASEKQVGKFLRGLTIIFK